MSSPALENLSPGSTPTSRFLANFYTRPPKRRGQPASTMLRYLRSRMPIISGWSWQRRATAPNGNDGNRAAGCRHGRPEGQMPLLGWSGIALADMSSCMATRYSRSFNFGFGSKRSLDGLCSDDEVAPIPVNGVPCGSASFETTFSSEAPGSEAPDVADRHFLFFYRGIDRRFFGRRDRQAGR